MVCVKCDRCGETYDLYGGVEEDGERKANSTGTQTSYHDAGLNCDVNRFYLCSDCMESFNRWLENPDFDYDEDEDEDPDEISRLEHVFDDDYEDDEFDDWIEWARNSLVDYALTDIRKKKERKRND